MVDTINLPIILSAAFVAAASPGPATLAIAGTSMQQGRKFGLALASGVTTGSLIWSVAASLGLGALMLANVWAFEALRYFGAAYLLFLAFKSAKSALAPNAKTRHIQPAI
ncbi:LysE family transporter, partial [Corallococcus exiguus]|uniref:LysE family translocator n=1 Tax=Corallococcus exiguus TaxID=83462 RepID=UPI00147533CA|nr:LysE family transporter [Corallococcus exiguus]